MAVKPAARQWYRITVQADGQAADLYVFDAIGKSFWDDETVTAKRFVDDLAALPASVTTLRVHVNSPGGDPFDAVAIANALRAQNTEKGRTVEVLIEGLAASAATIITSAGDTIRIARNALVMIHEPSGLVWGPAADMRKMADTLDTIRDAIIATYRWVSSLSVEDLAAMMAAETWMGAEDAVKNGFATEIVEPVRVAAHFQPESAKLLGNIPERFRSRVAELTARPRSADDDIAPDENGHCPDGFEKGEDGMCHLMRAAAPKDIVRLCREAGVLDLAESLIESGATLEAVTARITSEKGRRSAAEARAREIRSLCATAKLPELADGYIAGAMTAADVKQHLTTITARMDRIEIDAGLPPGQTTASSGAVKLNVTEIYAARNRREPATTTAKGA